MKRSVRFSIYILLVCIGFAIIAKRLSFDPANPNAVGMRDILAFWCGYQLTEQGISPYNAERIIALQGSLGFRTDDPQLFWNPPWTLAMLAPVLRLDLASAAKAWLLINIILLFSSGALVRSTFGNTKTPAWLVATGVFVPAWEVIRGGQLTLLLTFSIALFLWCIKHHADFFAGVSLILLSVKPHVVYLYLIVVLYWIVQERRWMILFASVAAFAALLALTVATVPVAFATWNPHAYSPTHWKSATLVTFIRLLFQKQNGEVPDWPILAVPALAALATLFLCAQRGVKWQRALPHVLFGTTFFAPYGWTYDHTVLLIVVVMTVTLSSQLERRTERQVLYAFLLLQLGLILFHGTVRLLHYYFWIPLAFYLVWMWAQKKIEAAERESGQSLPVYL